MKMSAIFLLIVGCFWALLVLWLFLTIAGVADLPKSAATAVLYWCGMLIGPVVLIVGSALLLQRASSRPGVVLVGLGCVIFTGFALYNSITGMQRQPLQVQPLYWFYIVLLLLMLLSDMAAYKIYRAQLH
jgi:hypothetical protein